MKNRNILTKAMMMRVFSGILLGFALTLSAHETKPQTDVPKTFAEKEIIAVEMKKIAKQLDVKCEYCHTDAERGLKEGDYTLMTKEGEFAHEMMFPISKKFKVECSHCHVGGADLTAAGERSLKDMKFMKRFKREKKGNLKCTSCHVPGEKGQEFTELTDLAKKLMP